jgi:hypothetical protein
LQVKAKKDIILAKKMALDALKVPTLLDFNTSSSSGEEREIGLEKVRVMEQAVKQRYLREKQEDKRRGKVEREESRRRGELKRRLS